MLGIAKSLIFSGQQGDVKNADGNKQWQDLRLSESATTRSPEIGVILLLCQKPDPTTNRRLKSIRE